MPRKTSLARTSITIPADLLRMADRLARQLDRSRSWVLGEAVRRWATTHTGAPLAQAVRETVQVPYASTPPALGEHRLAQLRSDMAMSLDQRVHAAEEANRLDRALRPPCPGLRITLFDHYQEYLDWKKYEGIMR
jgi:hypothetical protein